jgi:hypothetical protein
MHLFSVGRDGIDLIDEDDGGTIFFCFFKGFSEVALCLSCHFGHDFWTVDEEEESSCLVCNSSGDECFA